MTDRSEFTKKKLLKVCIIVTSIILTISFLILLDGISFYPTANDWTYEQIDDGRDHGGMNSIALDNNGYPHVCYSNGFKPILVRYAKWNDTSWNIEIIDEINEHQKVGMSISLDSADNAHIIYSGDGLKHSQWNGTAWENETVDPGGSTYLSSAFDREDNLHLCYTRSEGLMYAKRDGNGWQIEAVDSTGISCYSTGISCSLTIDSNNFPHISYSDGSDLKYARWNGNTWDIKKVDNDGAHTSIALDSKEHPSISYFVGRELKIARWKGNSWNIETIEKDWLCEVDGWTTIAFDKDDNAHINFIGGCNLMFARHTKAGWALEDLIHVSSNSPTSMALDEGGNAHIVGYGGGDVYYIKITEYDSDGDGVIDKSDFLPYFNNYVFYVLVPLIIDIFLIAVYILRFKRKTEKKTNIVDVEPK